MANKKDLAKLKIGNITPSGQASDSETLLPHISRDQLLVYGSIFDHFQRVLKLQEKAFQHQLEQRDERIAVLEKKVDDITDLMVSLLNSVDKANDLQVQQSPLDDTKKEPSGLDYSESIFSHGDEPQIPSNLPESLPSPEENTAAIKQKIAEVKAKLSKLAEPYKSLALEDIKANPSLADSNREFEWLAQAYSSLLSLIDEEEPRAHFSMYEDVQTTFWDMHKLKYGIFLSDRDINIHFTHTIRRTPVPRDYRKSKQLLLWEIQAGKYYDEESEEIAWSKLLLDLDVSSAGFDSQEREKSSQEKNVKSILEEQKNVQDKNVKATQDEKANQNHRIPTSEKNTVPVQRYTQDVKSTETSKAKPTKSKQTAETDPFSTLWNMMQHEADNSPEIDNAFFDDEEVQMKIALLLWQSYRSLMEHAGSFFARNKFSLDEMKDKFSKLYEACPILGMMFSDQFGLHFLDVNNLDYLTETSVDSGVVVFKHGKAYCDQALELIQRHKSNIVEFLVKVMFPLEQDKMASKQSGGMFSNDDIDIVNNSVVDEK